jgi:hypothetical protein
MTGTNYLGTDRLEPDPLQRAGYNGRNFKELLLGRGGVKLSE